MPNMNKYKVHIHRENMGYIIVEAKSASEAEEHIRQGNWTDEQFIIKDENTIVIDVEGTI